MAEHQLPKLTARVRFPSPAPPATVLGTGFDPTQRSEDTERIASRARVYANGAQPQREARRSDRVTLSRVGDQTLQLDQFRWPWRPTRPVDRSQRAKKCLER